MHRRGLLGLAAILVAAGCATPAPSALAVSAPDASEHASLAPSEAPVETAHESGSANSEPTGFSWRDEPDAPIARLEMATTGHEGRVWLAGGLSSSGAALDELAIWDPGANAWSEGPVLPLPVHHAALVSDGERLVLPGGYIGGGFNLPTELTWTLEDGADTWAAGPPLPEPRAAGAAAWDGSRIVYGGGVGPGGVTGEVYLLENGEWRELGSLPRPREHLAAASDGAGRVWLLGGRVGSLTSNLSDAALIEGDEIRPLEPLPTSRGGVAAFHLPDAGGCLTGGETPDRALDVVECVDSDGTVTTLEPMLHARHGHGAAVLDGVLYMILGGPTPALSVHASIESASLSSR